MTQIEHRVEIEAALTNPDYSDREFTAEEIAEGVHRRFIGGVWDTHGKRQLDFLTSQGLLPGHRLLDVGCGCFRAGRHFIDYLEPGNYHGIDANHSLLQVGYDVELNDEQRAKVPVTNLRANDRFDGDFGVKFDYAIANSVFSHVSLNHIRLCLYRLSSVMEPGGTFFATFFVRGKDTPLDFVKPTKKGKAFFTEKNLYWYYRSDLRWAASFGQWKFDYIGDWGHPAGQRMARFTRLEDDRPTAAAAVAPPAPTDLISRGRRWAARKLDPAP